MKLSIEQQKSPQVTALLQMVPRHSSIGNLSPVQWWRETESQGWGLNTTVLGVGLVQKRGSPLLFSLARLGCSKKGPHHMKAPGPWTSQPLKLQELVSELYDSVSGVLWYQH